ncbi:MAG: hypothetical protein ACLQNG_10640 [Acidimicrobiales bacterium]
MNKGALSLMVTAGLLLAACARATATSSVGVAITVPSTAGAPTIGSTITLTDRLNGGATFLVELVKVIDPAMAAPAGIGAPSGQRLVGIELKISGDLGAESSDAFGDTAVTEASGQILQPYIAASADGITGCPVLGNLGSFKVVVGTSVLGCVVFALPQSALLVDMEFTADLGQDVAKWVIQPTKTGSDLARHFLADIAPFDALVIRLNTFPASTPPSSPAYDGVASQAGSALTAFNKELLAFKLAGEAAIDARDLVSADRALALDLEHMSSVDITKLKHDNAVFSAADSALRADLGLPQAGGP